ncbi:M14 family metallopeptidase [Kriegella aquimaris]|uniref:Zinc carboxypeptidase n=1 Tax=Kriegella aquimaris TaxID=192904 RepID=A0A1G9WEF8_9FLAO|nr:M14 family metallopeptidase [Kriegella aquimaris]SDM82932.1 Zinc carboxypeptidase [Kriegella aquimaris]
MKWILLPMMLLISLTSTAQQALQSPSEFLGYELGTQFTRHHEVVDYFKQLSEARPDQVVFIEYGKTYERRPLFIVYFSSADNIKNIEKIRQTHLKSIRGENNSEKAIVWLSYNVHGNEASSTEASMQTIFELLTNKSEYLKNTVVVMDPCSNPDGRDRYVNWYNQYKNTPNNIDPESKEHQEGWWNGRSNHYMFDLNRDWAWLTQLESQQRLNIYNQWLPHVHVDFHEQGVDSPYYFAPAAEPFHEVITDFQRNFQVTIGKNHAKYFDANGWFYFTKEVYDLLYPSYGDTYPTYNGSIGMTYEQGGGGRAGLGIINGLGDTLTLNDRIEHHRITGLSTLEVVAKNTKTLNEEFVKFHQDKNYKYKSYVLKGNNDNTDALRRLLEQHQIEYGKATQTNIKGFDYDSGKSGNFKIDTTHVVISTNQPKGTLVKVLFEPNAKLSDSLTYDITAWSLPYAYGLNAIASETNIASRPFYNRTVVQEKKSNLSNDTYAFLAKWKSIKDAQFLAELLKEDIRVRYTKEPFVLDNQTYDRGSLIITRADNVNKSDFVKRLNDISNKHRIVLTPTRTGFVDKGKDFGSKNVKAIKPVKIAVLSEKPTSSLHFGEIWHFFEQQLNYPITVLDSDNLLQTDLTKYDVLIFPGGDGYKEFLDKDELENLTNWIKNGGKLVAMGGALKGLSDQKAFSLKKKIVKSDSIINMTSFDISQREGIKNLITGAIFKTAVDKTHPLAFGYDKTYFTLKMGNDAYQYLENGSVVYLEKKDRNPVAGFAGSTAMEKIGETLVFGVERHGNGQIVYMVDNPLFRGFWENGKLFFANALFLVD